MYLRMTPPWLKSARFRPEESASSTGPQLKRTSCLRRALLSHICLPVFRVAGNRCSPGFLPTKQSCKPLQRVHQFSEHSPGILQDNPIHKDMLYAAKTAGLRFILNVILNGEREIIASFSGGLEEAHAEGCRFLTSLASVNKVPCDITVVTNGGYPLDQNIYQAVKGLTSAEAANKVGTVLAVRAFTTTWRNAKRRRSFWNAFRTSTADTPFP